MEQMKEILRRIHDGETCFKPVSTKTEDVKAFQAIAKRIVSAKDRGFLVKANFQRSYMAGTYSDILNIVVSGGLTFEGEQFLLNEPEAREKELKKQDLFEVKVGAFGVKLNAIEAFRRWKGRKNRG